MTEATLDASVVVKWFHSHGEARVEAARTLRAQFEAGELRAVAPPLLWLEILNVAARRWTWPEAKLDDLAQGLSSLGIELIEPEIAVVARWAARGLTAYDAAYVAVAEQTGARLVTDDQQIATIAPELTSPLEAIYPGN